MNPKHCLYGFVVGTVAALTAIPHDVREQFYLLPDHEHVPGDHAPVAPARIEAGLTSNTKIYDWPTIWYVPPQV